MFHPKVLRILELCFGTTFYRKITTYAIITGFLTKLAVILCAFFFNFPRHISEEIVHPKRSSKLISKIELSKSKISPLKDRKSSYLFFYSKTDKFVDSGILLPRKLLKAMKLFTE